MKPVAVFFVIALIPAAVLTARAKTVTTPQGMSNEKSVSGVAGPATAARNSGSSQDQAAQSPAQSSTHPSKKALKKAKVASPPPMHDPN